MEHIYTVATQGFSPPPFPFFTWIWWQQVWFVMPIPIRSFTDPTYWQKYVWQCLMWLASTGNVVPNVPIIILTNVQQHSEIFQSLKTYLRMLASRTERKIRARLNQSRGSSSPVSCYIHWLTRLSQEVTHRVCKEDNVSPTMLVHRNNT